MYTPAKFRQHNPAELQAFIAEHPLATLIAQTEHGLEAAHLPLQWHDDGSAHGCLHGHFARANPIWQTALPEQNWLAVFQHSGHYISANWYPGKTQHHKAVPTWNYQAVHIRGRLNIIDDPARVFAMLAALTAAHEQTQPRPWSLADAPADYLAAMSRAIVCFEIRIDSIEGKYKLSQNQNAADRQSVIDGLHDLQQHEAEHMAGLVARFAPDAG